MNSVLETEEYYMLKNMGYELFSIMFNNIFFKKKNSKI